VNFWKDNPVFRGIVYALGAVALIALFVMRHPSAPRASGNQSEQSPVGVPPSPVIKPAVATHVNSVDIRARCQPELKETPSAPNFEVGENYNRAAVQLKVRFVVDKNGFVMNAYVTGANVVTPADQEAALDYVRHLTFEPPAAEECETIKMQMVGNFHISKDSGGDWVTIFDVHPVYSLSGDKVVVNPN
jgi:hypothetical protein